MTSTVVVVVVVVLSQSNTQLRLPHLLYDIEPGIEVMWRKTIKHASSLFLIKHGFLTNQIARRVLSIL